MKPEWKKILTKCVPTITEDEVLSFEKELGCNLPKDYRAFLLEINGGEIAVDHEIPTSNESFDGFSLNSLWPLTAPPPFTGVREYRRIQEANRLFIPNALAVGDDMGTGFFLILMKGPEEGSIYFVYKDDAMNSSAEWDKMHFAAPKYMSRVSDSFATLGSAILENRIE
jgi:hypothetical protein